MPRLFHRNEWFYELSPTALAEKEFEGLLRANAAALKPGFRIVPYSKTVYAPDGSSARADLAFIDNGYREWMVIEVEMNRHSLHGHVLPQVRTLRDGRYTADHAAFLAQKEPALDHARLAEMIRVSQPQVVVIANKRDVEWDFELGRLQIPQMIMEIYRSGRNRHIFVVDGELKALPTDVLTKIEVDTILPNMAVVHSPAGVNFATGKDIELLWHGQLTVWRRLDIADRCYITPKARMPLVVGKRYSIRLSADTYLALEEIVSE